MNASPGIGRMYAQLVAYTARRARHTLASAAAAVCPCGGGHTAVQDVRLLETAGRL